MRTSDKLRSDILSQLAAVTRDLTLFADPKPEHRKAKACFWNHFADADAAPPKDIDLALARKHCGDRRIDQWWELPGFRDWFTNAEEFKQRVEFLSQMALDAMEDILRDKSANVMAKMSAVKLIMEMGNKLPSRQREEKYADEKIAEMDRKELEQFIQKNLRKLPIQKESLPDSKDSGSIEAEAGTAD